VESFVINTHHRPNHFVDFFGTDAPDNDATGRDAALRRPSESVLTSAIQLDQDPSGAGRRSASLPFQGSYRNRRITLAHEPVLLGTGGGIKNVERLLTTESFIVYSGDLLTDFALEPLIEEHLRKENDVTLALRETDFAKGIALKNGRIVDIENRYGHPGEYDFANVSIWNRTVFPRIPAGQSVSFIPIVIDWIGQGGRIGGAVVQDGKWFNIGSRIEYLAVHRFISEKSWKPDYITTPEWPVAIAADAVIDPSAKLSGFYSVGARCQVGGSATLENTILWPGAQIASRSHLHDCIVRTDQRVKGEHHDCDI
jgi:NDP-sugar pyrophosphorylase family protein